MAVYTQDHRRIGISTSLGKDALLLSQFEGTEPISGLFQYSLSLLSENDAIDAREVIGHPVQFWVEHPDETPRWFHGMVNRFEYFGRGDRLSLYRAQVVPTLWFLSLNSDCRIFQNLTVPQIIAEVLSRRGLNDFDQSGIRSSYPTLEYCVQYNESDFAFVSRLMEAVGIFYFFRHSEDGHKLIMADSNAAFVPAKDSEVRFVDNLSERSFNNEIWNWHHTYQFRPGKWAHRDFNFKTPTSNMMSTVNSLLRLSGNSAIEVYEYPGGYDVRGEGDSRARVRMEAEEVHHDVVEGDSYCRSFSPGLTFQMKGHHSAVESDREYVISSVRHRMDASAQFTTGGSSQSRGYENEFTCVPKESPYRPLRNTTVPRIHGTQTAIVVGPADEEIYTDEFGRVKVQFHWDREGKYNENSSCWLRVSQVHAGQGWGMMDLPRIGEEVIVSFLEGDPDRPLIVGRVYNGVNNVPFNLPAEKTRRGNSTKTYKGAGYNEMSMDDTPGKEQLRMNAQYDMNSIVNHDQTLDVGNNQTEKVGVDRTREVGNNEKVTIGVNQETSVGSNRSMTVGSSHTETVGAGQTISVGSTQTISVGTMKNETVGLMSNEMVGAMKTTNVGAVYSIIAGAAMNTAVGFVSAEEVGMTKKVIVGSSFEISAGAKLEITVGASKLIMDSGGTITLEGTALKFSASGNVKIDGSVIDLN